MNNTLYSYDLYGEEENDYFLYIICLVLPLFYFTVIPRFYSNATTNDDVENDAVDVKLPDKVKSIVEQDADFLEKNRVKFLRMYSPEQDDPVWNQQIDSIFYSPKELNKLLQDEHNEIEIKWNQKMIMKNTPRGNVTMHYNAYKQGFTYYSDTQSIPYGVLNALAMDYVRLFNCRDFFMDEIETPGYRPSKLAALQLLEEKEKKEQDKKEKNNSGIDLDNAPFAKFKNYDTTEPATSAYEKKETVNGNADKANTKRRNCFIFGGKIRDLNVLKPHLKEKKGGFTSDLMPAPNMGYAEFKKRMLEKK